MKDATGLNVVVIHNDAVKFDELVQFLPLFTAVVVGPGPGNPHDASDVGIIPQLFSYSLASDSAVPILGVCLGFQSMCVACDGPVERLRQIRHGQAYEIEHCGEDLFADIPQRFKSVRYHSLFAPRLPSNLQLLASCEDQGDKIVMAARHKEQPWWGVQYHPESICSENGAKLLKNFVQLAHSYNASSSRAVKCDPSLLSQLSALSIAEAPRIAISQLREVSPNVRCVNYHTDKSVIDICDSLHHFNRDFILLNAAAEPGKWCIIGIQDDESVEITHYQTASNSHIVYEKKNTTTEAKQVASIWDYLSTFMASKLAVHNKTEFPFIGGLLGVIGYEEGDYISIDKIPRPSTPDSKLMYVNKVILRNNATNETFLVSSSEDNNSTTNFIDSITRILSSPTPDFTTLDKIPVLSTTLPDEALYQKQFAQCQEFISSGDSYELCLTAQTKIAIPNTIDPWDIYKTLTNLNPAPYSAFFRFNDSILISSSPERFVSWDRDHCELRPIKGTVKKSKDITLNKATEILNTPKELGENLMIVDLIRHDLYQLLNNVQVTKLMGVEEYSSVYQLVSVIRGELSSTGFTGFDILSRSLPPGSMTGAPKKRSVEILQELEPDKRGFYSGVCGYWSIEDKADWSVIIRSLFHYSDDELNSASSNNWNIGAGGAITTLSNCADEWSEMVVKLKSAYQIFDLPTR